MTAKQTWEQTYRKHREDALSKYDAMVLASAAKRGKVGNSIAEYIPATGVEVTWTKDRGLQYWSGVYELKRETAERIVFVIKHSDCGPTCELCGTAAVQS